MPDFNKTALICGATGQDGTYLAQHLLGLGYRVFGTSRDAQMGGAKNFQRLGIDGQVAMLSMAGNDFRSVIQVLDKVRPDEIYNLAGQSSVGLSFEQPVETLESHAVATLNLLESMRFMKLPARFYSAGSSECFGDTGMHAADENTPFRPRSPYAVAKATAFWEVASYREAYGLFACTGILFNHESPLRPERFVTQKIVRTAIRIANGSNERLRLGNLDIERDWGWAPEYVQAMWRMLQHPEPHDFVIATGTSSTLEEFVSIAFDRFGLSWRDYVDIDKELFRPSDLKFSRANPNKARIALDWAPQSDLKSVILNMIDGVYS